MARNQGGDVVLDLAEALSNKGRGIVGDDGAEELSYMSLAIKPLRVH